MTDRKVELDECVLESCDQHPDLVIKSTDGTKLTTQNVTHARLCVLPTTMEVEEGGETVTKPAAYYVFHKEVVRESGGESESEPKPEPDRETEPKPTSDPDPEPDPEPESTAETNDVDPDDLDGNRKVVFDKIVEATVTKGSITIGELAGKCIDANLPPSAVHNVARGLAEDGYVAEVEDAVFKA